MKKTVIFALFTGFMLAAASGYCDSGATITGSRGNGPDAGRHAHRAQLIAERKGNPQTAAGETTRPAAAPREESHASKFWKNEAERSGVKEWKAPSLNPVPWFQEQGRKYKERKAASK